MKKPRNIANCPRGDTHPSSRLTEDKVREIRAMRTTGVTYRALSVTYGASVPTIRQVCTNVTWKHVPERAAFTRKGNTRLTAEQVKQLLKDAKAGIPRQVIADRYGVTIAWVFALMRKHAK